MALIIENSHGERSVIITPETIWETLVLAWYMFKYPDKYRVLCFRKDPNESNQSND